MSQICIIGASNIKHISLISLYTRFLDEKKIPYDIIYMDRYGIEEQTNAEKQYRYQSGPIGGKNSRFLAFAQFRRFAKKIIKKNKYSLIITWQTTSAYLFADILLFRYRKRYIVNIRDYVAENNFLIRPIIRRLVRRSAMNAISSEGFKTFLPDGDYIRVNSINDELLAGNRVLNGINHKAPYIIGFAGNCRYFRESYKLIDSLANDKRFELWYCGTHSEKLSEYAKEHNINNVMTKPTFAPEDTLNIFERFDMVNSAFGNDALDNSTLMPIRLYTAISMYIPMLVSEGTQLALEVGKSDIGYVIESYENLGDRLVDYFNHLNDSVFKNNCDSYIENARKQNKAFYRQLEKILEDM